MQLLGRMQALPWPPVQGSGMRVRQERLSLAKQLLAQRPLRIIPLVNPALLQNGHDKINEVLQRLRRHDAADVEPVNACLLNP